MMLGVSSGKCFGKSGFGVGVPFHFIGPEVAFPLFDIVDLLLVLCTPEEGIGVYIPVVEPFFSFADEPVFPKRAGVLAELQWLILGDERVPDPVVVEIDLALDLQFLAQVSTERRKPENNKGLLEQGDVVFHRLVVQVGDLSQFVKGDRLNNGQSHRVKDFTDDGHIKLENGQTLSRDYRNFTLGYYRTSHSSQGKDADDVFIAQSSASFPASNEKQFYVSASRGIERCLVYTDDKEALKLAALQDANRMSAAEIAEISQDRSLWLIARNSMMQQYKETMEKDFSTKEHAYETEFESLGREFSAQADGPGGHEPGL